VHLLGCGNSVNVQPFVLSWQTAYKIHIITRQKSSSVVYFDQSDRFIDRRPDVDKVLVELLVE
jgi:hypothetical protein